MRELGLLTPRTRIISIQLKEPPKELVHGWTPQSPSVGRGAEAALFDNAANQASSVTLNLTSSELIGITPGPAGGQTTLSADEQIECEQAVLASPEFQAALKKQYGIDDTKLVMVDIWSAGNYGAEEDRTRRLARPLCFLRTDPPTTAMRAHRGHSPGRRSEHDEGDPRRGVWPLAAPAATGQLRRRPRPGSTRRHQAAGDHPAGRAELCGRGQSGALAEVELRHRLQRPRRADAPPSPLH